MKATCAVRDSSPGPDPWTWDSRWRCRTRCHEQWGRAQPSRWTVRSVAYSPFCLMNPKLQRRFKWHGLLACSEQDLPNSVLVEQGQL